MTFAEDFADAAGDLAAELGEVVWWQASPAAEIEELTAIVGKERTEETEERGTLRKRRVRTVSLLVDAVGEFDGIGSARHDARIYLADPDAGGVAWTVDRVESAGDVWITIQVIRDETREMGHSGYRKR